MKTIQIPLELAEEIIEAVEATDNRQPEWYHKLKKLVDEQTKTKPLTFTDLFELDDITPTVKCLVDLNNIQRVEAFVRSTEETYVFDGDVWVPKG